MNCEIVVCFLFFLAHEKFSEPRILGYLFLIMTVIEIRILLFT